MYLGIFADILGGFCIWAFIVIGLCIPVPGFHLYVVFVEEPKLKERFGRIYEEYTKSVPRWIPKVFIKPWFFKILRFLFSFYLRRLLRI